MKIQVKYYEWTWTVTFSMPTVNQILISDQNDRLCGLVITVPGYRSRCPRFDSRRYQIFWVVGLERGPLRFVRITEELLERKVTAPV
jgi:hypothetical protein